MSFSQIVLGFALHDLFEETEKNPSKEKNRSMYNIHISNEVLHMKKAHESAEFRDLHNKPEK